MKKIFLIAVLILTLLTGVSGAATYVFQYNDVVNPTAGQILVNTGAIYEGAPAGTICRVFVQTYSTVAATLAVRLKNEVGTVVGTYKFMSPANDRGMFGEPTMQLDIINNYSLEVVAGTNITGTLHGSIFVEPISGY